MHLRTPFPPYTAFPFSLNLKMGSNSGTVEAAVIQTNVMISISIYSTFKN